MWQVWDTRFGPPPPSAVHLVAAPALYAGPLEPVIKRAWNKKQIFKFGSRGLFNSRRTTSTWNIAWCVNHEYAACYSEVVGWNLFRLRFNVSLSFWMSMFQFAEMFHFHDKLGGSSCDPPSHSINRRPRRLCLISFCVPIIRASPVASFVQKR